MVIAITGATGFIGKRLMDKHIHLGDEVRILSRKLILNLSEKVVVFNGDLTNLSSLEDFVKNVDILYHCAAEIKNKGIMHQVNVKGTENLIVASKNNVKHWVQLSSTGVYGAVYKGVVTEQQVFNPHNEYERSKLEADKLVITAGEKGWFTYSIIRPSNVFGPEMSNQSLFQLIKAVDAGKYFYIGKPGAKANYVSVENVIDALFLAATKKCALGQVYIISDSAPLEDFIDTIAKTLSRPLPSKRVPLFIVRLVGFIGDSIPGSPITTGRINALTNKVTYSSKFIIEHLGFSSQVDIIHAIESLVEKYKCQLKENRRIK